MRDAKPKPWEYQRYVNYEAVFQGYVDIPKHAYDILFRENRRFLTQYETLSNYDNSYWKIGDLIQFQHGFIGFDRNEEWQSWCLKDEDLQKYLEENFPRHEKVPKYARNQYAIMLGRYKFTKFKGPKYRDYGSIVMMLTGTHVGHVRRFYNCSPWDRIDMYPYYNKIKELDCNALFHGVKLNKDVLQFLTELMEKIADDYN